MKRTQQTFPIFAGMQFTYPGTTKNKLHKVGYYVMEFIWSADGALLKENKLKTVFY